MSVSHTVAAMAADPNPGDWNDPVNRAIAAMVRQLHAEGVAPDLLDRAVRKGYLCAETREF